jgi:hypothetical protein
MSLDSRAILKTTDVYVVHGRRLLDDDASSDSHHGTYFDIKDMSRLGKKQEFMRNFRFYSILGFTSTLMATWEALLARVHSTHHLSPHERLTVSVDHRVSHSLTVAQRASSGAIPAPSCS